MPALLPFVCLALGALLFRRVDRHAGLSFGRREALLAAAVSAALFAVAVAELSSLVSGFGHVFVLGAWLLLAIALAAAVLRRRRESAEPETGGLDRASGQEIALLSGLALLAAAVALTAGAAAPNNRDSLAYHLSRIAHWIQDGGVFHYPTHVLRQLTL